MRKPANPSVSRRKALAVGAGAVAAGAVAAPIFGLAMKSGSTDTSLLSWWPQQGANLAVAGTNEWTAYVNKDFSVQTEHGKGTARLLQVQDLPSSGDRPPEVSRESAFALYFSTPKGAVPVGDRIYGVTNPAGQQMQVYFSATTRKMMAIFN
jgi:hypothetical protein